MPPRRFARRDGVQVEPVGTIWAAYSPASGDSILLNDESAAILEVLLDGPATTAQVCAALEPDAADAQGLHDLVDQSWTMLIGAGLVGVVPAQSSPTGVP